MGVVERVVDEFTRAPSFDEPQCSQDAQMLGDGGLAYADDRREVAGRKLVVNEDVNEGETRWICQGTKEFGHRR